MNKIEIFKIFGAAHNVTGNLAKYCTIGTLGVVGINLLTAGIMDIIKKSIKKSIKK